LFLILILSHPRFLDITHVTMCVQRYGLKIKTVIINNK